jgi:uncharacterized protein (DUF849 family)
MKFIINLAPTGNIPMPTEALRVPVTPSAIADEVLECAKAGASMVHLHARDEQARPTCDPARFSSIIEHIRSRNEDIVITATTSGRLFGAFEQRSAALDLPRDLRPDMASLTLSSLNFIDQASINPPEMVFRLAERMAERGIVPELEIFDLGMVNMLHVLIGKGLVRPPYYVNLLFGNIASAQATLLGMAALVAALPPETVIVFAGLGRAQARVSAVAAAMAEGVRVGLEDALWLDTGQTRPASNLALVRRAAALACAIDRPIATPAEVRQRLGLSGAGGSAA